MMGSARMLVALLLVSVTGPVVAQSAGSRITVGLLSLHSADYEKAGDIGASAVRRGMQSLGYEEGREFVIAERHAEGDSSRLPKLAADLAAENVTLIIAVGTEATQAAAAATANIPMAGVGDPIRAGFIFSLPYPGGNITGTALLIPETAAKQIEILKEALPSLRTVAILRRKTNAHDRMASAMSGAAAALRLTSFEIIVDAINDLPRAFEEMKRVNAGGFIVLANPALDDMRDDIARLAAQFGLPGVGWQPYHVSAGYLLSYGPNLSEMHARVAQYVDKIIKGRKPSDLPVEQAERFTLALNLITARALGLTIPPTLLARADEVIE
jgi:putative ABC transport system substrate-binding protein